MRNHYKDSLLRPLFSNKQALLEHLHPPIPGRWEETSGWDFDLVNNRLWS
jgi:hypothetical protein